ncbi:MAG: TrmJ/YjtD family RNA methyltransferase [Bacteroidales bacterium]
MKEVIFILADAAREENIGAAARAIKTMGLSKLYLVAPMANHLGERSRATAHGSQEILENAKVFSSLSEAIKNIDLVIGSTAKKRSVAQTYHPVEDLPQIIFDKGTTIKSVAIVFGGEESGMSNEQLAQCHFLSTIPMYRKYPSLNLAQSVMVYATYLSKVTFNWKKKTIDPPVEAELPIVRDKARQILADVDMQPDNLIYSRIMERLMLMNKDDINLFHSFCKYYLKKYHGRVK